ncbi:hypothetical protein CKM354_000078300 [Cercospora kikuchii]|uniref:CENP-V/GFA domain-containing protein n=1 Tax=Cercospora kikuchii TaxID=84275 RepID=A0A9P3CEP3_9PEZI|nr:uncharacterized protein CKM354_000078300 [Cercospora kikuchii]GIZ37333.1 hypothetical protein CKM354_000078300 [Cercospora kikuchii]
MGSDSDSKKRAAEEDTEQTLKQQKQDDDTTPEKKSIKGSCHCGFIKYTFDATSLPLSANRCNCTFCQKLGLTGHGLKNLSKDFHLISPDSKENPALGSYAPKVKTGAKYFCKECGTHVWQEGYYEWEGQRHDFFSVNLATVDQPQDGVDLSETKIRYEDGLHDNWAAGSREKPWPNGLP